MAKVFDGANPCGYFLDIKNAQSFLDTLRHHGYFATLEPIQDVTMNVALIHDYYGKHSNKDKKFELVYRVQVPVTEH